MGEILVGLFALLVGVSFCFSGNVMMRILFPIMGFFAGFTAGAGMIAAISGDGFLGTLFGWVVGFFIGLLFAVLAYFFYAFAIILAFAGMGFAVTVGLLGLLSIDWNWLVAILGIVVGILFGLVALATSMPLIVLVIATAFFGSAIILYGMMLVFNTASLGDFSNGTVMLRIRNNLGIYLLFVAQAISGVVFQMRQLTAEAKKMQDLWKSSPTFEEFMSKQK